MQRRFFEVLYQSRTYVARRGKMLITALLALAVVGFSGPAVAAPQPIVDGEFPDDADGLAAVLLDGDYQCTGSIVSNYWVLTAKHCLYDGGSRVANSRLSVRVKSIYWQSGGGVVNIATSRVRTSHDIAMLKLDRSANAESVRLPTATTTVGATTYAFGWGRTCSFSICIPSPRIKRATQSVVSINGIDLYGGRAVRTTGLNGNVCFGDSGGPLFKLVDGRRYQVGVLSSGDGSCGTTAVSWATVPDSRDWIQYVMDTV